MWRQLLCNFVCLSCFFLRSPYKVVPITGGQLAGKCQMFCVLCNFTECLCMYESHLQRCAFNDSVYIPFEMGNRTCFIMKSETALE